MSEVSSQALADSTLALSESVCELCGSASRTPTAGVSSLDIGPESLVIPTCEVLWPTPRGQDSYERSNWKTIKKVNEESGDLTLVRRVKYLQRTGSCPCRCHQSMSSAAASPALASASPVEEKDSTMRARVFGPSSLELLASYSPGGWSSKTSPDSCDADPSSTPATDAYAAGLIDGEGCIYIDKKHTLRVEVGVSDKGRPMLDWLKTNYGGTIRQTREATKKWEAASGWLLLADTASEFLAALLPHLQLKAEQAKLGMLMQTLRAEMDHTLTGRVRWSPEGRERAEELRRRIMELNRKGPQTTPTLAGETIAQRVAGTWVTAQLNLLNEAGSTSFSETWPRSGMTRNGTAYRRQPLAPLTAAIASGSWPTPHGMPKAEYKRRQGPSGNELGRAVNKAERWGTPTARDWKDTGDMSNVPENGLLGRQVLNRERMTSDGLYTTPCADDTGHRKGKYSQGGTALSTQAGGALNPTWVEWLQGFPLGWTEVE